MEGNDTVGKRIRRLREDAHMTQKEMGNHIGVTRQSVYKWESDSVKPVTEYLVKLSKLFNVDVNYLIDADGVQTVKETAATTSVQRSARKRASGKQWIIASVAMGLLLIVFTAMTGCVGIIVFSDNVGVQTVTIAGIDKWTFYVFIAINVILFLIEIVTVTITVKKYRCKPKFTSL